ncbi:Chitin synthase, class 3, partial [Haplosporangium gracile]
TRMVAGEVAGADHGGKEGQFDSSHIVMKRWGEWEKERRQKAAILAGLPTPQFLVSDSGEDWHVKEEELSDESSSSRRTGDSCLPFVGRHLTTGSSGSAGTGVYSLSDSAYNPTMPGMDSIPLMNMHAPAPGGTIGRQRASQMPLLSGSSTFNNGVVVVPDRVAPGSRPSYSSLPKLSNSNNSSDYMPPPLPPSGPRLNSIDTRAPSPSPLSATIMTSDPPATNARSEPPIPRQDS